jgi:hypothetical protein
MSNLFIPRLHDEAYAAPVPLPSSTPIELAYARVREEIAAVPDDALQPINTDVPMAHGIVKGALPGIVAMRAQLATLPGFDVAAFDKLGDYADALAYLHAAKKRTGAPAPVLPAMLEEALAFRETTLATVRLLVSLRVLDQSVVAASSGNTGYRNVGFDLLTLCGPLTEAQLVRGKSLGNMMLEAVAARERTTSRMAEVQLERVRAFTLLSRTYDEARRAVAYLRWHEEDADRIAPALYVSRPSGRRGADSEPDDLAEETRSPSLAPTAPAPDPDDAFAGNPNGESLFVTREELDADGR